MDGKAMYDYLNVHLPFSSGHAQRKQTPVGKGFDTFTGHLYWRC
jgi:hypothetical protein